MSYYEPETSKEPEKKGLSGWLERKRAQHGVLYRCVLFMAQLQFLAFFAMMISVCYRGELIPLMVYYIVNTVGWAIMMIAYWSDKLENEYVGTGRRRY